MNEQEKRFVWKEGYQAYQDDKRIRDNPYSPEQEEFEIWKDGYYDGAWDD